MTVEIINKSRHSLPKYETVASAGVDLRANIDAPIVIGPLERCLVKTGLKKKPLLEWLWGPLLVVPLLLLSVLVLLLQVHLC
jgi:hypothetical protein